MILRPRTGKKSLVRASECSPQMWICLPVAAAMVLYAASITGKLAARAGRDGAEGSTPPRANRGARWQGCARRACSAACAVRASLRHVPTCGGEAESHAEAALLRLIEALIQRFLGVGQAPQVPRPDSQRIGATAQTLGPLDQRPA